MKENMLEEEEKGTYTKIWIHHKNNSCSYYILTHRQSFDQKNKGVRLYRNRSIIPAVKVFLTCCHDAE
jgi:hypothetical protein